MSKTIFNFDDLFKFPDSMFTVKTVKTLTEPTPDEDVKTTVEPDGAKTVELTIEVPGLTNEQVNVGIKPDKLRVDWTDRHGRARERVYDIKAHYSNVSARVRNGLLTITIVFPNGGHDKPTNGFTPVAAE